MNKYCSCNYNYAALLQIEISKPILQYHTKHGNTMIVSLQRALMLDT